MKNLFKLFACLIISILFFGLSLGGTSALAKEETEYAPGRTINLPIVMYHATHPKNAGKYSITPKTLESDLNYIKEKGYTAITVQDLIDFKENGDSLPEKPIMITFDDGYVNNYTYAYPLLKDYQTKAIFSVVGKLTEDNYDKDGNTKPSWAHLDFDQIKELSKSGYVEIQNHTYDLHTNNGTKYGLTKAKSESVEHYEARITEDLSRADRILKKGSGVITTAVTYPYGIYNKETVPILKKMGYKASFTCNEGINVINRNSSLFNLKRYNRPSGISTQEFFKKMGA